MRKKLTRRPSAAMLVAMTALVSSFAGPAVADQVARVANHISGKHIKNGSVTHADIKNGTISAPDIRDGGVQTDDIGTFQVQTADIAPNSVRGDKIPNNTIDESDIQSNAVGSRQVIDDSLGGGDIVESTLGTVPSATNAANAANADTVDGLDAADLVTEDERLSFQDWMDKGEDPITLDVFGPFTFTGVCEDDGSGGTEARIEVRTSEANSYVSAYDDDDDFDPGDVVTVVENSGTSEHDENGYEIYGLYAPSSPRIIMDDDGQSTAVMINTRGADCRFFSDR